MADEFWATHVHAVPCSGTKIVFFLVFFCVFNVYMFLMMGCDMIYDMI